MINLRKYQKQGVDTIREKSKDGHKQIIYCCATGGGKTVVGADITAKANANGKRVLWLVHREEIADQTLKKLVLMGGEAPGLIKGDTYMKDSLTHVAMVQTLSNRLDFMAKNYILPDIIISDEAHHGVANTWLKIFNYVKRYKKQSLTIGLTATPQRTDGIGLSSAGYTCLINGPQYPDLINPEYTGGDVFLSEPVVFYSPLTFELSRAKSKKKRKDFDPTSEEKIFGERIVINNCVDMYNKYFFGSPCIIFCASVNDCMEVSAAMNAAGWRGGAVYDKMDSEERRDYISGLGDGRYQFLCSYDILGEGVDIPVTAGCILRRRTTSIIIYLQQVGRSARKYPGKKYNLIIDQCGNSIPGIMHGHPLTRRHWTLEGIVKEQGEQELKMTICEGCGAHIAGKPSVCPYCGSSLRSVSEFTEKTIKEVEAPMSVLPAPAQTGYNDISEIEEFEVKDRESEIINRIRNGHLSDYNRFGELAKMIGKDNSWVSTVWRKYYG